MFALTPFRNSLVSTGRRGSLTDIDDIFNRLLWAPDASVSGRFSDFDMYEKDGSLRISIEAPGVNPDEVEIRISKDRVQLKSKNDGDRKKDGADDGKTWYSRKSASSFNYELSLPFEIDTEKADASFENGIISIVAPRLMISESRVLSLKKS
ncbi:MAG: Hsp20/alpha crystallin family protein [Synergistaceae bacterium]|jgi:HSP20 family protein|nr:Hsp20/alpha crystallin family protein [Synergistaceae bacterium]